MAWLRLVLAVIFIVFGTYALVLLYRSRYILDIRARLVLSCSYNHIPSEYKLMLNTI